MSNFNFASRGCTDIGKNERTSCSWMKTENSVENLSSEKRRVIARLFGRKIATDPIAH
jgi:hypothetical protein